MAWIYRLDATVLAAALACAMIAAAWAGTRVAAWRAPADVDSGGVTTGIFGLLGLLLAFTFSMAGTRYDLNRELIVREADALGTAVLRADMYLEPDRSALRDDLRRYIEARIADNEAGMNQAARNSAGLQQTRARRAIWARVAQRSHDETQRTATLLMAATINEAFDLASDRRAAERAHVPVVIYFLLFAACLLGSFFAAYFSTRAVHFDWVAMLGFTTLACAVVYVALDIERPRRGLIDMRRAHLSMTEVRELLK